MIRSMLLSLGGDNVFCGQEEKKNPTIVLFSARFVLDSGPPSAYNGAIRKRMPDRAAAENGYACTAAVL